MKKNIVVFASGGGSNFRKICEGCASGYINGRVVLLVASADTIGAVGIASEYDIPSVLSTHEDLAATIKSFNPDLICLAGYLKLVTPDILALAPVMNIHPALLPKYGGKGMYGRHVHKAVVAAKETVTGPTIHFVDNEYDRGAIIMQRHVEISPADTPEEVAAKVLKEEHQLYPYVIKKFCEGKITVKDGKVNVQK
ncbi:phosphoribosylglycinamide formyltransferase/phosphoribosylglycinamide formyltransferase-1 [Parelusimicrobium proximum]|uniref:phosphoribosylglycinamide formyltransferase n=1 Tax=Parelusimicrobium proximum TaxID=3228953 RepID=UPI003D175218